jgi:AcrR family transcriptional regulator
MNANFLRQKHKEELRRAILDAAREIFVVEGYENFSMRKLAEKIEYSPGSIYRHFKNKQELFDFLVEESFARLLRTLMEVRNGEQVLDPVIELKKGLQTYVEFGLHNPNDYHFAFMLRPQVEQRPYKVHGAFELLRLKVRRCVEAKRFRALNVEMTAQALWASVHGITSLLIQRPTFPWVSKRKLIAQVIDSAVDGLVVTPNRFAQVGGDHANLCSR